MSTTKHKIFRIEIENNLNVEEISMKEFDSFLENPNHVYLNHTMSILTDSEDRFGKIFSINKGLVISLIYKDLNNTSLSIKEVGKKMKNLVSKEIKERTSLSMPNIKTAFDEELRNTTEKINDGNIRRGTRNRN